MQQKRSFPKRMLTLALVVLFLVTCVPIGQVSAQSSAKMTVYDMDGIGLPMSKLNGLPENSRIIETFTNIGGIYTTIFYGTTEEQNYISASTDGKNFTTAYPESDTIAGIPTEIAEIDWRSWVTPVYADGWYFLDMYGCTATNDFVDFYIKTTDFISWTYCEIIDSDIILPEGEHIYSDPELIGEYNGTYIASDVWEDMEYNSENNTAKLVYFISSDGKNWTKKTTPDITVEKLESTDPCFGSYIEIQITEVGVLFYSVAWNIVDAITVVTDFSDYYFTKDFTNYNKLDFSALGNCQGKIYADNSTADYDTLNLVKGFVDGAPIFYRMYGQMYQDPETYEIETRTNKTEIYTFDENTLKLVKDSEMADIDRFTYGFLTENQYVVVADNLDTSCSLYVKDGRDIVTYDTNGFNFSRMQFFYHVAYDNYPNGLKPDGTADVEYLIGSCDGKLIVTQNLFQSMYSISFPECTDTDQWSYFNFSGERGFYLQKMTQVSDGSVVQETKYEYYWVGVDDLLDYIKASVPVNPADINDDGKINAVDARWVLQAASGMRTLNEFQMSVADVNNDGKVNAVDARWILQIASGARIL